MHHKYIKWNLCLSLTAGIIISIFVSMHVSAQGIDFVEANERCLKLTSPGSKENGTCNGCVLFYMSTNADSPDPRCKAYLSLNKPVDPKSVEPLDPGELERDVAELMDRCDQSYTINCQCWEKEYRESRANGGGKYEAQPTSACYSRDRIKAYEYPHCVGTQWNMIEQFESYCSCVADDIADSIIEHGDFYRKNAWVDAAKACKLGQQERLTPESGKERYEEYGRRGPSFEPNAYKKVL